MLTYINILHFTLILIPLIFSLQLFTYPSTRKPSHKILGTLLIFVSLYYFVNAQFICSKINTCEFNLNFLFFLFLSITPFYYIYTKSLTEEFFVFKKKYLINFIPALFVLIFSIISVNFIKNQEPQNILSFKSIRLFAIVIYNIQIPVYTVLIFLSLKKHGKNLRENFAYENYQINLTWLKIFFIAFLIFSILDLSVYYFNPYLNLTPFYFILSNLFFIFLGYFGVRQNQIYNISNYKILNLPVESETQLKEITNQEIIENPEEILHDKIKVLSETKALEIYNSVLDLLENKKIYRKQDLSIFDIAEELNINKTYISNAINKISGTNFNTFINKYRIEESKKILINQEYNNLTIEAIANDVGFHSKSSFNTWFKKLTGKTPSEFKKQMQEMALQ